MILCPDFGLLRLHCDSVSPFFLILVFHFICLLLSCHALCIILSLLFQHHLLHLSISGMTGYIYSLQCVPCTHAHAINEPEMSFLLFIYFQIQFQFCFTLFFFSSSQVNFHSLQMTSPILQLLGMTFEAGIMNLVHLEPVTHCRAKSSFPSFGTPDSFHPLGFHHNQLSCQRN